LLLNADRTQQAFIQQRLMEADVLKLLRLNSMREATGLSRATIYSRVQAGLLPKPIKHGERISVWPSNEIDAITKATIAGKSSDEIRALVADLQRQRADA
jgi:prophage regulatory protein